MCIYFFVSMVKIMNFLCIFFTFDFYTQYMRVYGMPTQTIVIFKAYFTLYPIIARQNMLHMLMKKFYNVNVYKFHNYSCLCLCSYKNGVGLLVMNSVLYQSLSVQDQLYPDKKYSDQTHSFTSQLSNSRNIAPP